MDRSSRIRELPSGVRLLSFEGAASGLLRHGLPPERFEALSCLNAAELESPGNALDLAAQSIAVSFLAGEEPFWEAAAMLNALMDRANWKAPEMFWRIFLAFEDAETAVEPRVAAAERVQAALKRANG